MYVLPLLEGRLFFLMTLVFYRSLAGVCAGFDYRQGTSYIEEYIVHGDINRMCMSRVMSVFCV